MYPTLPRDAINFVLGFQKVHTYTPGGALECFRDLQKNVHILYISCLDENFGLRILILRNPDENQQLTLAADFIAVV